MDAEAGAPDKDHFTHFPAPPGFYSLYKDGSDAGPPPPEPVKGEIHALGEFINMDEPYVAPLDMPKLYTVQPDGSVAFKEELLKLNKGLLFLFMELLTVLVQQPSQYAGVLTPILHTMYNMMHLINLARPIQARETLKYALQSQIQEKRAALNSLRAEAARIRQEVLAVARQLAAVGGDAAESVPRHATQHAGEPAATAAAGEAAGEAAVATAMEEG